MVALRDSGADEKALDGKELLCSRDVRSFFPIFPLYLYFMPHLTFGCELGMKLSRN